MKRNDTWKKAKPKFRKIDQSDPEIANKIGEFSERTGYPRYCIVDLMVKGALSPDLNSELDRHMRDSVLPLLLKNRTFLKATLSKIGGHDAQLKFVNSLREETPFQDYIRSRLLKLQQKEKSLRLEVIIADLRNGGPYLKLAKKIDDSKLKSIIKKIKNKIHLVNNRKKAKSGGHKKLNWLRIQLVNITLSTKYFGDDFDFEKGISTANTYNSRTIGARLDELGADYPSTVEDQKKVLKIAARKVLQYLELNLPENEIDPWYGAGTSARLLSYSEGCTAEEKHKTTLSQILYKLWWMKELFEDHPLDLGIYETIRSTTDDAVNGCCSHGNQLPGSAGVSAGVSP